VPNGNGTGWKVAAIVGPLLAAGITIGMYAGLQSGQEGRIQKLETRQETMERAVHQMDVRQAVVVKELEEINKKLDKLLNGRP